MEFVKFWPWDFRMIGLFIYLFLFIIFGVLDPKEDVEERNVTD